MYLGHHDLGAAARFDQLSHNYTCFHYVFELTMSTISAFERSLDYYPHSRRGVRGYFIWVCMSVRTYNSKTFALLDLIFYIRSIIPVARPSSKMIRIGNFTIGRYHEICHPSYAKTSNACYGENMHYEPHVCHSERGSDISDGLVIMWNPCQCVWFAMMPTLT